jgi:hypothetical protein
LSFELNYGIILQRSIVNIAIIAILSILTAKLQVNRFVKAVLELSFSLKGQNWSDAILPLQQHSQQR